MSFASAVDLAPLARPAARPWHTRIARRLWGDRGVIPPPDLVIVERERGRVTRALRIFAPIPWRAGTLAARLVGSAPARRPLRAELPSLAIEHAQGRAWLHIPYGQGGELRVGATVTSLSSLVGAPPTRSASESPRVALPCGATVTLRFGDHTIAIAAVPAQT